MAWRCSLSQVRRILISAVDKEAAREQLPCHMKKNAEHNSNRLGTFTFILNWTVIKRARLVLAGTWAGGTAESLEIVLRVCMDPRIRFWGRRGAPAALTTSQRHLLGPSLLSAGQTRAALSCPGAGAVGGTHPVPSTLGSLAQGGWAGAPGKGCSLLGMVFKEYQGTEPVHLSYCVRWTITKNKVSWHFVKW